MVARVSDVIFFQKLLSGGVASLVFRAQQPPVPFGPEIRVVGKVAFRIHVVHPHYHIHGTQGQRRFYGISPVGHKTQPP